MNNISSLQTGAEQGHKSANTSPDHSRVPGILMVVGGLVLILSTYVLIWVLRGTLAETGPRELLSLRYGMGGLLLLYLTAGLPLGAILLAAGGARLYSAGQAGRVLVTLLAILLVFFTFHAIRLLTDLNFAFLLFAFTGFLFIALFITLVWIWAHRRSRLEPQRRGVADLQLGASVCFFSASNSDWRKSACSVMLKGGDMERPGGECIQERRRFPARLQQRGKKA